MLRVLIESYEDEANDQTEESDEPPPEREPLPEPFLQAIADRQPQPTQGTLSMEPTEISPEMAEAIPVLTTAAALLPPDEEEIPPPPSESLPPPPGQAFGNFHVEKGRYGPNTWGVDILHPSGEYEPVMIFLQREHPDWDGPTIGQWLMNNGLPQELAVRLGRQRQGALEGVAVAVHFPAVAQLSENEERHYAEKDAFSRAFIAAQQKKTKDSK